MKMLSPCAGVAERSKTLNSSLSFGSSSNSDWPCPEALLQIISARQKNGDVYLASPSQKVQRLFQITKLDGVVSIYPTVEEAVAAFHNN